MTKLSTESSAKARDSVILVTGLSGAGRTTCLKTLEDHGFEAVDNMPLSLMPALLAPFTSDHGTNPAHRIAIGIDTRTRDFNAETLLDNLAGLKTEAVSIFVIFLDCDTDILIRRFTETRRRHPLAKDRPVADGIRIEQQMLAALKMRADLVIDTSSLSLPGFRQFLEGVLNMAQTSAPTVMVTSFGFRNGLPREADMVFDVRFLTNPHYNSDLRSLDGLDQRVAAFVCKDAGFSVFFDNLTNYLAPLIPRFAAEGKSYLTIAIGCTGGRHRSVFVADKLAHWLRNTGHPVTLRHRDIEAAPVPR